MELLVITFFFIVVGFICRAGLARWILWGGTALMLLLTSSFLWVERHFEQVGCMQILTEGTPCAQGTWLTELGIIHLTAGLFTVAAGVFLVPMLLLIALAIETRHRKRERAA